MLMADPWTRILVHENKVSVEKGMQYAQTNEDSLNKEQASYDDLLDALRLSLRGCSIK